MGSNTPNHNRTDEITADQRLIDGLNKNASTITFMVIGGATETTKDIVATLQSRIDSAKAASSTRATWLTAVEADQALRDKTKTYVSGLRQALLVAFAGQTDTLADFGLTARKQRVVTPEAKVAAAAKAKATRAARHTMGKKQKAAIKGTVAPTTPAIAAPSAPTPSPTPPEAPAPAPVPPAPAQTAPTAPPAAPAPAPVPPAAKQAAPATPPAAPAPTPVTPAPAQTAPASPAAPAPAPEPPAPVQAAPTASPAVPVTPPAPTHGA